jgi:UDP-N-acetylmuramyl pentapeptide phosphotransferase/UDP-N-acetylglucosamine-1-phosphate transferase
VSAGAPAVRTATGAALAAGLLRTALASPLAATPAWQRTNHRGAPVSLVAGPVLALAATVAAPAPLPAAAVAGLGVAALGRYDDTAGARPEQRAAKGFRGHLAALRAGRPTSGAVKVVGIGLAGLASAALLGRRRPADLLLDGAVVAGAANLLNLLDLRPGRALKAGLAVAVATRQTGPAVVSALLLPADLAERTMLGDAGANALGALLGLGWLARGPSGTRRAAVLAVLTALTAASEVVSFSRVIDAVPPLRALDRLGRGAAGTS